MTLRELQRDNGDNGDNGDNEREAESGWTRYSAEWNPWYCVCGWPHVVIRPDYNRCVRCGTRREPGSPGGLAWEMAGEEFDMWYGRS